MPDEFIDTSVLVYAFDLSEPGKHAVAAGLITDLSERNEKGIVSNQVLLELYNVLTRFISNPVPADEASTIVEKFMSSPDWTKLNYDASTVRHAVLSATGNRAKIWDTLIAETMRENNIDTIITENVKDFKKIPGIKVINPFK